MVDLAPGNDWALETWGLAVRMHVEPDKAGPIAGGVWRLSWRDGVREAALERDENGSVVLDVGERAPGASWSESRHVTPGDNGLREALARVRDHVGERAGLPRCLPYIELNVGDGWAVPALSTPAGTAPEA